MFLGQADISRNPVVDNLLLQVPRDPWIETMISRVPMRNSKRRMWRGKLRLLRLSMGKCLQRRRWLLLSLLRMMRFMIVESHSLIIFPARIKIVLLLSLLKMGLQIRIVGNVERKGN
jgi:hypothetical protein